MLPRKVTVRNYFIVGSEQSYISSTIENYNSRVVLPIGNYFPVWFDAIVIIDDCRAFKVHSHDVRLTCAGAADVCVAAKNRKSSNYSNRNSVLQPQKIEKVLIILTTATVCCSRKK